MRLTLILVAVLLVPVHAMAAGDGPVEPHWNEIIAAIINMAIYIGLLVKFGRAPILAHFRARRQGLVAQMESAQKARETAAAALQVLRDRAAGLEAERAALMTEFRDQAAREREKALQAAEAMATKLVKDAESQAAQLARAAEADYRARLVGRALELARTELASSSTESVRKSWIDASIRQLQTSAQA